MRQMFSRFHVCALRCALAVILLSLVASVPANVLAVEKMKAEDVVAKHLESIGSAEARSAAKSRVVVGSTRAIFRSRSNAGVIDGRAVIGSINRKIMFGMGFTAPNYPGEKFGFDGKKFTIGYLTPGVRSTLGKFLLIHDNVFKEGLMGGTLTSAWPLLDLSDRGAKLEYAGTDKIGDQLVHKLEYSPKNTSRSPPLNQRAVIHSRHAFGQIGGGGDDSGGLSILTEMGWIPSQLLR